MSHDRRVPAPAVIRRLAANDAALFDDMLTLFGRVFADPDHYDAARPGPAYRERLLARAEFVALVAIREGHVAGALAGYELIKFEQERSEFYIYDLAVDEKHRRQGVATALIESFKEIAKAAGGWVVYVQADRGDDPAIALYSKLGAREDVLHFDMTLDN
jgi:aminoglycoside 3-N-acetyltransferase I